MKGHDKEYLDMYLCQDTFLRCSIYYYLRRNYITLFVMSSNFFARSKTMMNLILFFKTNCTALLTSLPKTIAFCLF